MASQKKPALGRSLAPRFGNGSAAAGQFSSEIQPESAEQQAILNESICQGHEMGWQWGLSITPHCRERVGARVITWPIVGITPAVMVRYTR
jgi:hypothetical protein